MSDDDEGRDELPFLFDPASHEGTEEAKRHRAEIREHNATHPRCAQCYNDLIDWEGRVEVDEDDEPLLDVVLVRGDLLCPRCWEALYCDPDKPRNQQWGSA
jgi:hypothetical protein